MVDYGIDKLVKRMNQGGNFIIFPYDIRIEDSKKRYSVVMVVPEWIENDIDADVKFQVALQDFLHEYFGEHITEEE